MTVHELLRYEISASWWAGFISNPKLQELVADYYLWKVNRKLRHWNRAVEIQRRFGK